MNSSHKRTGIMPTADEIAGMQWWNSMTETERARALAAAGWKSGGAWTPSAADAWAVHKRRAGLDEDLAPSKNS